MQCLFAERIQIFFFYNSVLRRQWEIVVAGTVRLGTLNRIPRHNLFQYLNGRCVTSILNMPSWDKNFNRFAKNWLIAQPWSLFSSRLPMYDFARRLSYSSGFKNRLFITDMPPRIPLSKKKKTIPDQWWVIIQYQCTSKQASHVNGGVVI